MADAYCKKHFISFCPDLSVDCPYCRIAELESELTTSRKEWNSLLETAEARLDAVEADRDDARRVMKEACEANRVFVARLDAVAPYVQHLPECDLRVAHPIALEYKLKCTCGLKALEARDG